MTTRCNLACDYCYAEGSVLNDYSIDVEFAKKGLIDYFTKNPSRHLRFFGSGEPTLEFEKIQEIKEFAYEIAGEKLIIEIQTNGVFSNQIAEWLASNANIIWISYDGLPEVHDSYRKTKHGEPTSAIVEKNIKNILNRNSNVQLGVRATITPLNIYKQREMIRYIADMGVRAIYSDPLFPAVGDNIRFPIHTDDNFMLDYAEGFLDSQDTANHLGVFYGSILTVNFDEHTELFCRSCLPSPHLTPDGFVSCCDMAFLGTILPDLVYGYYVKEEGKIFYDENKISEIRKRRIGNLLECSDCDIRFNCAGGCFGESVNETGKLLGVKKDYCKSIRFLAKHLQRNNSLYPYLHP
jgi:radical SAM protein with 4Fe4S-binding SPASM domain